MKITERKLPFDSKRQIREFELTNGQITIVVHDFGARVHQIFTPDKNGKFENILLSRDHPETYSTDKGYYGLICGPVAGRIAGAKFDDIQLEANENRNLLHSGENAWERQFWKVDFLENGIKFHLSDEKSGFPGPIIAEVSYILDASNLTVKISALSAQDTLFNPAFHPYFNLTGDKISTENHVIQAPISKVVETDNENIPTGRLLDVSDSIYDLNESVSIHQILQNKSDGFDTCFVFDEHRPSNLTVIDEKSGRRLTCQTDRKAVVIYTATNPEQDSSINGSKMTANRGIAIEFQELPDAIHHKNFGNIRLPKHQKKTFKTIYAFDVI